jgi:hypothetical protein
VEDASCTQFLHLASLRLNSPFVPDKSKLVTGGAILVPVLMAVVAAVAASAVVTILCEDFDTANSKLFVVCKMRDNLMCRILVQVYHEFIFMKEFVIQLCSVDDSQKSFLNGIEVVLKELEYRLEYVRTQFVTSLTHKAAAAKIKHSIAANHSFEIPVYWNTILVLVVKRS